MNKPRTIELSAEANKVLEKEYRSSTNASYRERCKVILLKSEGRSTKEVGGIVKMHRITVNKWLSRYEAEGIEGLRTKPGRGRKPIFNQVTDAEKVRLAVSQDRQRLKQAKVILEQEIGKEFSIKTLKRFLKSLAAATNE